MEKETIKDAAENSWLNNKSFNDRISYVNGFIDGFKSQKEINIDKYENCIGCRFYNSCGLRIDYDNVRCPDFLSQYQPVTIG